MTGGLQAAFSFTNAGEWLHSSRAGRCPRNSHTGSNGTFILNTKDYEGRLLWLYGWESDEWGLAEKYLACCNPRQNCHSSHISKYIDSFYDNVSDKCLQYSKRHVLTHVIWKLLWSIFFWTHPAQKRQEMTEGWTTQREPCASDFAPSVRNFYTNQDAELLPVQSGVFEANSRVASHLGFRRGLVRIPDISATSESWEQKGGGSRQRSRSFVGTVTRDQPVTECTVSKHMSSTGECGENRKNSFWLLFQSPNMRFYQAMQYS